MKTMCVRTEEALARPCFCAGSSDPLLLALINSFWLRLHGWQVSIYKILYGWASMGPPGVLGIWGEWLFIFRELGSTGNYFKGAREQAHNLGDIGSLAKKRKKNIRSLIFLKNFFCFWEASPQDPLINSKCIFFGTNRLIKIDWREKYGN